MPKLTKTFIDSLHPPAEKCHFEWDTVISGLGVRVWSSGKKVFVLKYRNKHQRQRKYTLGTYGSITLEKARELAQQRKGEIAGGIDPAAIRGHDRGGISVAELCDKFMREYSPTRHKERTRESYQGYIDKWINPAIGMLKVQAVARHDIVKFHQHITEKAPYTANRVLAMLSKMFNMSEAWGFRDDRTNPCYHVPKNPESKKERFLSNKEFARLGVVLDQQEKLQVEMPSAINAIRLLLYTGCRLREILNLKWEYVDFEESCFKLPDSKTGAKRVYFSPQVKEVLENIERVENNPYVLVGIVPGKQFHNIYKPWHRIRALAELGDIRIHDLRHSFASIAVANGLTLPMIGALLGHTQTQTTARYAHLIGEPVKNAAMLVNQKIAEAMQHGAEQPA